MDIKVKDVMTRGVVSIHEDDTVRNAAKILMDHNISGLIVVSRNGEISGIVSEMDIIKVIDKDMDSLKVKEIMTTPAKTIDKEDTILNAAKIMRRENIHRLVIQKGKGDLYGRINDIEYFPEGILSISDIVRVIATDK